MLSNIRLVLYVLDVAHASDLARYDRLVHRPWIPCIWVISWIRRSAAARSAEDDQTKVQQLRVYAG